MRAVQVLAFGGEENLKLQTDVPIPPVGEAEVLIKVGAVGVNPIETYIRRGYFAEDVPLPGPELPYIPGTDAAGVVEEVGPHVTKFKKGDRVYTVNSVSGTYAEYSTARDVHVGHLPDRLSFDQGAAIGIAYLTATKALQIRARARPGETCLVHGASGGVGIASVQIAKAIGLRVVGTAGTKEGMDLVLKAGADLVFNHREDGYVKAIQDAVGEVDIILEMVAGVNLQKDLDLVNTRGRIMVIGVRGRWLWEVNPMNTLLKEASIMGVNAGIMTDEELQEMNSMISAGLQLGWLEPKVSRVYSLGEAATAHYDILNNQGTTGKLVLDTTQQEA